MSVAVQPNLKISQNFIKDPHLAAYIIDRSSINAQDLVYEIGPGKGVLTAQLARRCNKVIAVEKDAWLASALLQKFASQTNLTVRTGDFLKVPLPDHPYKVFSNIPFNLTSAIVERLVRVSNPPEDAYLVLQKEAAEMYLGTSCACLRSVLLHPWFDLSLVHRFHRSDFIPQPGVDAVLLRFRKRKPPLVSQPDRQMYRNFMVYCFTCWQPTLEKILKPIFSYRQLKHIRRVLGIDLNVSPSQVGSQDWLSLFESFRCTASPQSAVVVAGSEARLKRQQHKLHKIHRTRN